MIDVVGIGRIGAAIARAMHRWPGSFDPGRQRAGLAPIQTPTTDFADGPEREASRAGIRSAPVFLLTAAREPDALAAGLRASAAQRAAGKRIIVLLLHPPEPERAVVQHATAHLAAEVDAIVVVPEYPHLSLLDCIVRAYRTAFGAGLNGQGAAAMPSGSEFLDLRAVFDGTRRADLGMGLASGAGRIFLATDAAIDAIGEGTLSAAEGVLVIVSGAETLRLAEVASALYQVHALTRANTQAVLAAHYDERMAADVRVIVIAAG
ncbi:cell division protein FtsZ [Burkholderia perseverans]|uniref:cell division protein FtsZ n=1 Tax=Burkholderia perseverans TaxID=2615214 RepID=UPI001FF02114|nr:cell division protein FtsZ [Burkholderia perseverans]